MVGRADMTILAPGRSFGGCFGHVSRPFPRVWTHSCQAPVQTPAHHPQIGQRKQCVQLRRVLGQAAVAHLHMAELALDDAERMLDLGADAGLDAFDLFGQRIQRICLVQQLSQTWAHGHMPLHIVLGIRSLVRTLVAGVAKDICLLPVQQTVGLDHIVDMSGRAAHGVNQAGIGIDANVRLHAEEPLLALLALVHLRISLTAGVLGRARRRDQRGINHRAAAQHQTLGAQQEIHGRQNPLGQLVLLQHMTETQDGALVGQSVIPATQAGEVTEQRHVVQRFFHRRVAQREPLLHEVNAQQRLHRERRTAALAFGHEWGDLRHQVGPRYHPVHLVEELPTSGALR